MRAVVDAKAPRAFGVAAVALVVGLYLSIGGLGLDRYLRKYWLYRGFAPPADPAFVAEKGTAARPAEALG